MADNGEAFRRAFVGGGGSFDKKPALAPTRSTDAPWSKKRTWDDVVASTPGNRTLKETVAANTPQLPQRPRVVPKADTNPQRQRNAIGFIKGMQRELTDEEWGRLTEPQKKAVQFNGELINAWDADMKDSRSDRRNTKGLLSQLGLDERTEGRLTDDLGLGLGPAVRVDELFDKPAPVHAVFANPTDKRQIQVNQIKAKLDSYLRGLSETRAVEDIEGAMARKDEYNFSDPDAKAYFELSFDFLRDRENLSATDATWPAVIENLKFDGYDPDEFKSYVLDRIQLLPIVKGQSTVEELQSWFGK